MIPQGCRARSPSTRTLKFLEGTAMKQKTTIAFIILLALLPILTISVGASAENPRLVLSSYEINEGQSVTVAPGTFELNFTLRNTSSSNLANTLLSHTQREAAIIPVHGNPNTRFIGSIGAGREYNGVLELHVPEETETGIYQLDFSLSYEIEYSTNRTLLSGSFVIYLQVINNPGIQMTRVDLSDNALGGGRRSLYLEYENPGATDLRNLQLVINADTYDQPRTQPLPVLRAGRNSSVEYTIQLAEAGVHTVEVHISYSDTNGDSQQTPPVSLQVLVDAAELSAAPSPPPGTQQPQTGLSSLIARMRNPAFFAVVFLSFMALIVIIVIIARRKRKRDIRKRWYFKNDNQKK